MSSSAPRRSEEQLREDAISIWKAGVDAVRSDRLVRDAIQIDGRHMTVADHFVDLDRVGRIVVVGAGKAGAGMAAGFEQALGPELLAEKQVTGWINVPADCVGQLETITLHPGRPAGLNEPTEEGVAGASRILEMVEGLGEDDLCVCLLSGGASALLPAPASGVSLADKQQVTRLLSSHGANIEELNTVRKQLSRIKGGGLARACRAGQLVTLVISDVIGDRLDIIGSGPTVEDPSTPQEALDILARFADQESDTPPAVLDHLRGRVASGENHPVNTPVTATLNTTIIGNNARAVDAAGVEAVRLGYAYVMSSANSDEGEAEDVGRQLATHALHMRDNPGPDCMISGGEPVVRLVASEKRGLGGRNQQLVLAALLKFLDESGASEVASPQAVESLRGIALLSGGTDGEDGPTDAAGAIICGEETIRCIQQQQLDPAKYLQSNDAYHFFEPLDALIKTGPTHTNVCDLRVVLVNRIAN